MPTLALHFNEHYKFLFPTLIFRSLVEETQVAAEQRKEEAATIEKLRQEIYR